MKYTALFGACFLIHMAGYGQDSLAIASDTARQLNEVIIHAYFHDHPLNEVPAAVGRIDTKLLERFNNTSLVSAVNTIPGVRMEERSPGSYRFAIRGSSLRSPFGIRNVKMYWNGLPLTDGGGNTYLNLIDNSALSSAEVIKGPGGSLYGAGTGGVVLLSSPIAAENKIGIAATAGSYGLIRYQAMGQVGTSKVKAMVNYSHQQSDGYRQQTKMRRDAFNSDLRFVLSSKSTLAASLFYADLFYQTPGGLTRAQFLENARQARPSGPAPGAVAQHAAIYNKTFYGGLVFDHQWNDHWSTNIGAYGSSTDFANPALRNYELRKEKNLGGRTETNYKYESENVKLRVTAGGEFQHFYSTLVDYGNRAGQVDTLQTSDKLYSTLGLVFVQLQMDLPKGFFLTLGASANLVNYELNRINPEPTVDQTRKFDQVLSPRVALLKKLGDKISLYASVSKGFSPPSLAEVRPSTGNFNNNLAPETGISYESGIRGRIGRRLTFDLAMYDFELSNTIVVQQSNGADYFINSGSTTQKGIEAYLSYDVLPEEAHLSIRIWNSYSFNHYRFNRYIQNGQNFSHNRLTGVAPNVATSGLDVWWKKRVYTTITTNYVDKIPLNDGNTEYAGSYFIAGARIGFANTIGPRTRLDVFAGIENVTNTKYSLGNDINAVGNRYYNAAAGRGFYVGVKTIF